MSNILALLFSYKNWGEEGRNPVKFGCVVGGGMLRRRRRRRSKSGERRTFDKVKKKIHTGGIS